MNLFDKLINQLKVTKMVSSNFKQSVFHYIKNTFTNLNNSDIEILVLLTSYLIYDIITRYDMTYYEEQFTQNSGRDVVSLCLTLLPFIDNSVYTKITSLKHILYIKDNLSIPSNILETKLKECIKENFPYSNFSLGLLNENKDTDTLLELYDIEKGQMIAEEVFNIPTSTNNFFTHKIYHCIHNNFVAMLETIKITNGKLYVNWINTTPMVNYKEHSFYKKSKKEIDKIIEICTKTDIDIDMEILKVIKNNKGLWLGDYYNILTNGYYRSMKDIKWVIFCRKISTKYYYSIQYLNRMFNNTLDTMFNYIDYDSMEDNDKLQFSNRISLIYNNIKYNISTLEDVEYEYDLLQNLFIFMSNNFSDKHLLPEEFTKFAINIIEDEMDLDPDEDKDYPITKQDIINTIGVLTPQHLWKYIKETLVELKTSIYGKFLIKGNKINMDYFNYILPDKKEKTDGCINLKNIYNIAKLLAHSTNDFIQYSTNYKGLYPDQSIDFFKRFCKTDDTNWINIKNNIKLQEGDNYISTMYNDTINKINNGWNQIKIELVWEYLRYNGLLTQFRVNTIDTYHQKDKLKEYFDANKNIFDENYFMTNDTYNNLTIYDKDEPDEKIKFSKLLTKKLSNYLFYANDWISLLNFFNHYINQSIIYVTGSTGTGKSTQVPKLTLYALKMYDYKMAGKVVCTQPRIVPTQDNAKRIAVEMGLNIMDIKKIGNFKTSNYYLQYQHNKDKHTKELCSHLTLKMVTDGSLLTELITNPLLKVQYKTPQMKDKTNYSNSIKNKYDIVIVDEAHEHNTNMDIILTLMRQVCLYNNMVRLIIVSATMDDDEPIYRYYYKLINSNIVYPIKNSIWHPVLSIPWFIDSIYLDRRMNISPPGATTQYNVDEIYNELMEEKYGDDEKKNSQLAQIESFKIVNMVCNKSISGDVLLFSTGEREIIEAVNYLNSTLPYGTIALPYYSTMDDKYRDMISNIDTTIGTIRNKRSMIGDQWGATYIVANDVSEGTYKRAVIIATNVAEASITIKSLKYVVDIGYSKVNRYDEIIDSFNMNIEKISESSRMQRRGRVGRVAEGTVYFTYGKGKRAKVAPKFIITTGDFHTTFLQLASNNTNNMELLWENKISPYLPFQFPHIYLSMDQLRKKYKNIKDKNIDVIIFSQFVLYNTNGKESIPSNYFYNFNEYQLDKLPSYFDRYIDGYKSNELFDKMGNFYIIHPFEDRLERNVMGGIIGYKYKHLTNNKSILDDKIYNYLIANMRIKMLYLPVNDSDKLSVSEFKKTEYFEKLNEMITITNNEMTEKDSNILLLGAGYNIITEACMVLSLLKAVSVINPNISSLVKQTGKFIEIERLRNRFGSDSDISSLFSICKTLQDELKNLELFKLIEQYKKGGGSLDNSLYKIKYENMCTLYYKKEYKKMESVETYNLFNWLHHNGKLDMKIGFLYWLGKSGLIQTKMKNNITMNISLIETICDRYYLSTSVILDYLNKLTVNILNIITAKKDIDEKTEEGVLDWVIKLRPTLLKNLKNNTVEFKLNLCFFFAQPLIAVKNGSSYIDMHAGGDLVINTLFNQLNTLCTTMGSYLYYYSADKGKMNLIASIDPTIPPIYYALHYNKDQIKTTYKVESDNNIVKFNNYNNIEWENLVNIVRNNWSFGTFPFNNTELTVVQQYIKNLRI